MRVKITSELIIDLDIDVSLLWFHPISLKRRIELDEETVLPKKRHLDHSVAHVGLI